MATVAGQIVHFTLTLIAAGIGAYLAMYLNARTWLAQEKWKLRRDLYLALLHNIEDASMALGQAASSTAQGGMPDSEFRSRLQSCIAEISKAKASAHLVSDEAVRLIGRTETKEIDAAFGRVFDEIRRWTEWPEAEMLSRRHAAEVELAQVFGRLKALLDEVYRDLAKAGRRDLKLDVPKLKG
jgi:hypothetical protein